MAVECVPDGPRLVTRAEAIGSGLTRYNTGLPCRNGHVCERFVYKYGCVRCVAEGNARCFVRHRDERLAHSRGHYQENRQYHLDKKARWRKANPGRKAEYDRSYAVANAAAVKRYQRRWVADNPVANATKSRNYRARVRAAEGSHTADDIEALFSIQRGRCAYFADCGQLIRKGYHVDHIIPLSKGGSNWFRNLQLCCAKCNQSKWAVDPIVYAQRNGRLV